MLTFIFSLVISMLSAPLIINFYKKKGWLDDPQKNPHAKKTHSKPIPRGGGLVVFLGIVIPALLFLQIDKYLIAILLGGLVLTIVGVLDDVFDIHPFVRIGVGIFASLLVIGAGIGIAYVTNPFSDGIIHLNNPQIPIFLFGKTRHIWIFADLFALFFIIWNMNIINWANGVDGQLPGFVTIAALIIAFLSLNFHDDPSQFNTANLSLMVAGSFLGLLYWNWFPQKMMPGYGAGSLAGYFLSILAILSGAKVATTLMVLAIPTADGIFTIFRRVLAGKSPFWGDRGHLHHKLMDVYGWNQRQIATLYWSTSLLMGIMSLYLNTAGKVIAISTSLIIVFAFMIWVKIKTSSLS